MLMPTSPSPPSGRYRSRFEGGRRELTPKALSPWGSSQQSQLFGLLPGKDWFRRWRRCEHLVQVSPQLVEIMLEVGDEGAVVQRRGGMDSGT